MAPLKVLILCGGKGTRSYPFTEYFPKVMMPVNGSPILVHLMRVYAAQGFTEFVLAAGHRKEMLYDYFSGRFTEWKIDIVDTGDEADTGDRVLGCAGYLGSTFLATYGDGLGDIDLAALLRRHRSAGGLATLTSVPLRSQYGMVVFDAQGQVRHFDEKPLMEDYWINAGFFVFQKAAFRHWQGHNLERDVLPEIARLGALYVYQHKGFWKSMDTSKDQQELEKLAENGTAPWRLLEKTKAQASRRARPASQKAAHA
jgi:glucose-1-phosphate cytidylyltransferase